MLGYDAYSKSLLFSLLDQKIRLFLLKRSVVNLTLFIKFQKTGSMGLKKAMVDKLFDLFIKQLEQEGTYEEYSISSILVETPDYNFLINDAATTLNRAEESLKKIFDEIFGNAFPLENGVELKEIKNSEDVDFSFIKDKNLIREVGTYDVYDYLENSKIIDSFEENKFYVETFWRENNNKPELFYASTGEKEKNKNLAFSKGARLMVNITSLLELTGSEKPPGNSSFGPPNNFADQSLKPGSSVPFYGNGFYESMKDYPLPFLSKFIDTTETTPPIGNDVPSYTYDIKINEYNSMLDLAIKAVYTTNVSFGKGNNWIYGAETVGGAGSATKLKGSFYSKIKKISESKDSSGSDLGLYDKIDYNFLKNSKSLISFEISKEQKSGIFPDSPKIKFYTAPTFKLYFPIILGEYVSKGGESDDQIIQKLLTDNQIIDLLKKVNVKEIIKLLTPENLIDQTDDLYKQIFGEATSSEDQMLNNMLLKLINFDEET